MKDIREYLIEADMKTTGKTYGQAEENYRQAFDNDQEMLKGIFEMMEAYANDKVEEYKNQIVNG